MSREEADQFAQFVAELKRRVLEDCQAVRELGGERFLKEFDCKLPKTPTAPAASLIVLPPPPEKIKTEAEEIQSLNDDLRKLEGELDIMTRKSSDKANQQRENLYSGGAVAPKLGAETGSEVDKSGKGRLASQNRSEGVQARSRRPDPGAGPGDERKGKTLVVRNDDSAGGSDDDVLARQLREAAEQESDPVLKKKLWTEYKKYKDSMQ
jgi:hypothetical protein